MFVKWLTYQATLGSHHQHTCTKKLEHFDEIGTCEKRNFTPKIRDGLLVLSRSNYLLTKLGCRVFRETMVVVTKYW